MKQKLGRELLGKELQERGYTGDVDKLIENAGTLNIACYFWENQFRQEIDYFKGKVPGAWIENKFKKDSKVFYDYYMQKKIKHVIGNKAAVNETTNGRKI